MNRNFQITPNFNLNEFIRYEDPLPSKQILDNIFYLAHRLQVVRDVVGQPIYISSGYRTKKHNDDIGGSPGSKHLTGQAADINVKNIPPDKLAVILKNWSGGLGVYNGHVHVDLDATKINGEYRRWTGKSS